MTRKTRSWKKIATKSRRFKSVPKEFHTVTPYLAIRGAAQAIEWYKKAFGAKEGMKMLEQGRHP